jgi:hypothetical protein
MPKLEHPTYFDESQHRFYEHQFDSVFQPGPSVLEEFLSVVAGCVAKKLKPLNQAGQLQADKTS